MVRRQISDELKQMALSMSLQGIRDSEIRENTGISERSLKRIRKTHRALGEVSGKQAILGRSRILSGTEVKVRHIYVYTCLALSYFFSSFVIASDASPTWHSLSCKPSSVKFATSRFHSQQSYGACNGRD